MDLEVEFCPLLARIQGYLLQYLEEDESKFNDDLAKSPEQFAAYVGRCISEQPADAGSLQSVHDLLLASSGLILLEPDCPHTQSALAKLHGARLPAALYLVSLPGGLQPALLRRLRESPRGAELRAALVAAACEAPCWPALPSLLAACLQAPAEAGGDVGKLVEGLAAAAVTTDGGPALALTACLAILLDHLLETPPPAEETSPPPLATAAGSLVSAATALYRRITLNEWLEWAERDASPSPDSPSVQSTVADTLREIAALAEDARREDRASLLPAGMAALLETVRPYAGQERLSREERLQAVAQRDRRSRRHFRALLDEFDVEDEELVRCLGGGGDLITVEDLWRLLTVVEQSAAQPSELRDRVIKVLIAELLKDPAAGPRHRLVEHVLSSAGRQLRSSSWEQQLRTGSAQLAGAGDNTVSEASVSQMCGLLLQSPRPLLQSLVLQAAESGGKASIMAALLPALQRRLPLHLLREDAGDDGAADTASTAADTANTAVDTANTAAATAETSGSDAATAEPLGLTEALILRQLAETTELKPFRQLSQLLVAAVGCQLTAVDQRLARRVTALPSPKRLRLHLIQELLDSAAPRSPVWCLPLAQFTTIALDETLDLDTAVGAEAMLDQRQRALHCLRTMGDVAEIDSGCLSSLSARCHPVTQLYVSRLLLHRGPPEDADPLLLCLTEDAAPAWLPDQHTLIKATLASYLPYLCEPEWGRLHDCLLQHSAGASPLTGPAPAEHRPLARAVWYYGDLVTLWTSAVEGVAPEESLLLPPDRAAGCVRAIAVQVKRSLERLSASCPAEYGDELSAVFLPLTHLMTLVKDSAVRDALDTLALYITAEFIKQLTTRMEQKSAELSPDPQPPRAQPTSPCLDWELDQMDASAGPLSQFVVGCFNIPSDSPVKRRVLQHISGSVLGSLAPQQRVPG